MSLSDLVFGCWHKRCSFPITVRGKLRRSIAAASVTGTYVVCLDCGREFSYDWSQIKMLASKPHPVGGSDRDHRSRFQGGLRPALDHFLKTQRPSQPFGEQSAVSRSG